MRIQITRSHLLPILCGILTFSYAASVAASEVQVEEKDKFGGRKIAHIHNADDPQEVPDKSIANKNMAGVESSKTFDKVDYSYEPLLEQPSKSFENDPSVYKTSEATEEDLVVSSGGGNPADAGEAQSQSQAAAASGGEAPAQTQATAQAQTQTAPVVTQQQPTAPDRNPIPVAAAPSMSEPVAAQGNSVPVRTENANATGPAPVAIATGPSNCVCQSPAAPVAPAPVPSQSPRVAQVKGKQTACSAGHASKLRVLYAKKGKTQLYTQPHGAKTKKLARGDHFLPGKKHKGWVEVPGQGWVKSTRITTRPVGRKATAWAANH